MMHRLLVASDGTDGARGALRWARRLQERDGCAVEVISVVEPLPLFDAGFGVTLPTDLLESQAEGLERQLRQQLASEARDSAWPLHIAHGPAAATIVRHAERFDAEMIIVGLRRHGPVDRLFGTETALHITRLAHRPVLAVHPDGERLPRCAVVAVDFTDFSRRAAGAAAGVVAVPGVVHVAHAMSGLEMLPSAEDQWRRDYESFVRGRLEKLSDDLHVADGVDVRAHVLEGEAAPAILDLADVEGAELIAAGSHGHSFVGRVLMGSVSTRLIRGAHTSVLIWPPLDRAVFDDREDKDTDAGAVHPWVTEMQAFTERNAGRRTLLEIDDPELGAQHSGTNFPLRGVDYDPRGDRVEIMLGELSTVEGHLTHSIPAPLSLEVVRGEWDRDDALRIGLRSGQLILRILIQ